MPSTATNFDIGAPLNPTLNDLLVNQGTIVTRTATRFSLEITEGDWAGYVVSFLGTDFQFVIGTPYSGEILDIAVADPGGNVFLTYDWTGPLGNQIGSGVTIDQFWQSYPNWRPDTTTFAADQ
jgi:hypothetical protein